MTEDARSAVHAIIVGVMLVLIVGLLIVAAIFWPNSQVGGGSSVLVGMVVGWLISMAWEMSRDTW